jgi:hypothetical protein
MLLPVSENQFQNYPLRASGRKGMHEGFWWESQNERDKQEDRDGDGRIILKLILEK